MSQFYQSGTVPLPNATAVAANQDIAANGSMVLSGAYVTNGIANFINNGFSAIISFTSVNNLAGVWFTVTGTQNGVLASQTIAGPNNNTVYTTSCFDTVTSITVSGNANAVSAGIGLSGYLSAITLNTAQTNKIMNYSLGFPPNTTMNAVITYTVYYSLANIASSGQTYTQAITSGLLLPMNSAANIAATYASTVGQIVPLTIACQSIVVKVVYSGNSIANITQLGQMQFLQI